MQPRVTLGSLRPHVTSKSVLTSHKALGTVNSCGCKLSSDRPTRTFYGSVFPSSPNTLPKSQLLLLCLNIEGQSSGWHTLDVAVLLASSPPALGLASLHTPAPFCLELAILSAVVHSGLST